MFLKELLLEPCLAHCRRLLLISMGSEVKRRILRYKHLSEQMPDAHHERAYMFSQVCRIEPKTVTTTFAHACVNINSSVKLYTFDNPLDMYTGDAMTVNVNLSGLTCTSCAR